MGVGLPNLMMIGQGEEERSPMKYSKSVIEIRIRIDPVPGWGHDPQDHIKMLESFLMNSVPHYKPEVHFLRVEEEKEA